MTTQPEQTIIAGTGMLTLIDGLTFAISDASGDIDGGLEGLIVADTRHLSRLAVRVEGGPVRPLGAAVLAPGHARFRGVFAPAEGHADAPLEVDRQRRVVAGALVEDVVLHWWAESPSRVSLSLGVAADFDDIFEIRRLETGPRETGGQVRCDRTPNGLFFVDDRTDLATDVHFTPDPEHLIGAEAAWSPLLRRGEPWSLRVTIEARNPARGGGERLDVNALPHSRPEVQVHSTPSDLALACAASLEDLDSLALPDALDPTRRLMAAGIPWFVALFGRDSLVTGHQARAFLPRQMVDTLGGLAARQGSRGDPGNEEGPGKILHEVRLTPRPWLGHGTVAGARPYYGSIDATPLFLILYGTAFRWGASREDIEELLPAARAALEWMQGPGDPDGDGLLEYQPEGSRSLSNQSWKDSENAVQFADGRLAEGPIAMVEVQGYAYRARLEFAEVLRHLGEESEAAQLEAEAATLRALIRDQYWCAGVDGHPGYFGLALDGDKRCVASVASNMGHLLWCDVPSREEAAEVAGHLAGPEMASGWGLRTLSRAMSGFNPNSYHVGSVWPHDTALACEGLRRYRLDRPALKVAGDLMDALALFDHRLPELFGGHDRARGQDVPVPYPAACRPQAWAAGVPLQLATMFIGLDPDVPNGRVSLRPALPDKLDSLEVLGIQFPGGLLSVRVSREAGTQVLSAPADLVVELRGA